MHSVVDLDADAFLIAGIQSDADRVARLHIHRHISVLFNFSAILIGGCSDETMRWHNNVTSASKMLLISIVSVR